MSNLLGSGESVITFLIPPSGDLIFEVLSSLEKTSTPYESQPLYGPCVIHDLFIKEFVGSEVSGTNVSLVPTQSVSLLFENRNEVLIS